MPVTYKKEAEQPIKQKEKTKRGPVIAFAIPCALILLFFLVCRNAHWAQAISENISMPVQRVLGALSSRVPFSAMELLYCIAAGGLILFAVRSVCLVAAQGRHFRAFLKRLFLLALAALYLYAAFLWLWGVNYHTPTLAERNGFAASGVTAEDLAYVTAYFADHANQYAVQVPRDEEGQYVDDPSLYWGESIHLYDTFSAEFHYPRQTAYPAKAMFFGKLMSAMGFTGIYFPFTAEANINTAAPACLTPFVLAHEAAHQQGIASEQEANFAGIVTCIDSGNVMYNYAGYLSGLQNLLNTLDRADQNASFQISTLLNNEVLTDLFANSAYWAALQSPVTEAAGNIYDGYLKANGDARGIQSYGACVDLLVQYYRQ